MRAREFDNSKLVIFDIDDTLVNTDTKVNVVKDGKIVKRLNSHDFTHYKLEPGEEFDFGAFRDAREFFANARPIAPMIRQLKQDIATGNRVIMVTARADFNDRDIFLSTFEKWGIDMSKVHVYRAGNIQMKVATEEKKKIILRHLLGKTHYDKVIMYDDAVPNLDAFLSLAQEYPWSKFYAWHVDREGGATEYHRSGITETIRKIGANRWRLYSKDGSRNLGTFDSLAAAKKHEQQVQAFKHMKEQAVAEGQFDSMVKADQAERNAYKKFVADRAGGDWSRGARLYAKLKNRPADDIFGDDARLQQFMRIKFNFGNFTKQDWRDFWLLSQHADKYPGFQKQALDAIEKHLGQDNDYYRYLSDRISCARTGQQKYGTQDGCEKQGVAEDLTQGRNLNPETEKYVRDHKWKLTTVNPMDLDTDAFDDPYNRVVDIDVDHPVNFKDPIIVDANGVIIDGFHRAYQAQRAGLKSIPAYVPVQKVTEGVRAYHGNQGGIDTEQLHAPMWFTASRPDAEHYAGDDGYVVVVDLDITNPYILRPGEEANTILRRWQELQALGYDGIYDRRLGDWIPFTREQIRVISKDDVMKENFADGKVSGKSRPGRVKRSGASCKGSVTDLRAKARKYGGERGKMYHWCANMKSGKKNK